RVVGEHAERRDDVFLEVLVLVVTPDDDEVRREVVQHAPGPGEPRHEPLPMTARRPDALIAPPLLPPRLPPSLGRPVVAGKAGLPRSVPRPPRRPDQRDVAALRRDRRRHGGSRTTRAAVKRTGGGRPPRRGAVPQHAGGPAPLARDDRRRPLSRDGPRLQRLD